MFQKSRSRAACGGVALTAAALTSAGTASAQGGSIVRYNCDLNGVVGVMTAQVEAISQSGVVVGPGPTPEIGVIGTGEVSLVYQGEVRSPNALYIFTGRDAFADFTDAQTYARFRVRFDAQPNGALVMTVNPFGPGPTQHLCWPTR